MGVTERSLQRETRGGKCLCFNISITGNEEENRINLNDMTS